MKALKQIFGSSNAGSYENLTIDAYRSDFERRQHTIVDVRSPGEYKMGHLPGTVNIPLNQLQQRIEDIPAGKPVVVVCASGNRSRSGANILAKAGREEVYNLMGGTKAWAQLGYPLK